MASFTMQKMLMELVKSFTVSTQIYILRQTVLTREKRLIQTLMRGRKSNILTYWVLTCLAMLITLGHQQTMSYYLK